MWLLLPRKLFSSIAGLLGFYKTPPLFNHVEICLITSAIARACGHLCNRDMSLLILLLAPSHFYRVYTFRWQLYPFYFACILYILTNTQYSLPLIITLFLTLVLCFVFPLIPPIIHDNHTTHVGTQDICLTSSTNSKFWVKLYYPAVTHVTAIDTVGFLIDTCLLIAAWILSRFGFFQDVNGLVALSGVCLLHGSAIAVELHHNSPLSKCFPHPNYSKGLARYMKMPALIFSHMNLMHLHCFEDAAADTTQDLKVILYCHGLSGAASNYSKTCMELASKGYLVVAPEFNDGSASYTAFPSGEERYYEFHNLKGLSPEWYRFYEARLEERTKQLHATMQFLSTVHRGGVDAYYKVFLRWSHGNHSKCLQSLRGKISSAKPMLIGHSFGGTTCVFAASASSATAAAFQQQWGARALLLKDAWMDPLGLVLEQKSVQEPVFPVMAMYATLFQWERNLRLETEYVHQAEVHYHVKLNGSGHMNYADGAMMAPMVASRLKSVGKQDPVDLLDAIVRLTLAYVDRIDYGDKQTGSIAHVLSSNVELFDVISSKE